MEESLYDEDAPIAPATPEEQQMAETIWGALERISTYASMGGDPGAGDMDVIFDGHFNLLLLARAVLRARSSHNPAD